MIRNRIPRFRNLQNLHVIPTASNFNSKPIPVLAESPNITIIPHPLSTTVDISNTNCEQKMFNQNKPKGRFNKPRKNRNRRKRQPKCFPLTEAEIRNSSYNWYDPSYLNQTVYSDPPQEKIEEIDENIPEIPIEEDFEEVEVASEDGDGKQEILVGFRASRLQYLNYKKKCFFRPKFYKFGSQRTLVNCLNVQDNSSVDIDIVSEAEYEIDEVDNLDQSDSQDQQISKINKSYEHSERNQEEKPIEKSKVVEINDVNESSKRIFKTCIEENADINQGQSLIQSSFDTWKSHLIGLEYLIEIQDKNKAKYYCVLCSEYLPVEEIPSINVINHINGCKHVIGYLEKHFPSYGFKFDENNVDTQRKVCEEINEKMGYFSICITNFDYFNKNEQKIKNIILNASHVNEECIKLETCVYQKEKDSDTLKDVQYVIENIIEKVLIFVENKTMDSEDVLVENSSVEVENESNHIVSSELLSDSVKKANKKYKCKESKPKNSLKSPKSFLKYKNNSNLSSYLKVKYAKAKSKGLMPLKGLSNRNRRLSAEKGEKRKSREEKHVDKTSSPTEPEEVISEFIHSDTSKKVVEDKEKVLQKPTVHSKHCRKIVQAIYDCSLLKRYS